MWGLEWFRAIWGVQKAFVQISSIACFALGESPKGSGGNPPCQGTDVTTVTDIPPPRENITKIIRPEYFCVIFGGRLQQNCVITKKLIPQELFCVIGDRRDLRLVHDELREIYVAPKKIFLREFYCVIDYAKPSQSPRK